MRLDEIDFSPTTGWAWRIGGTHHNAVRYDHGGGRVTYTIFKNIWEDGRYVTTETWMSVEPLVAQCVLYELFGNPQG